MSEDAADRILTFDDMAGMIKELSINDSIKRLLLKHNNALRSSQEKMIDYRERCIKAESERDALREEISRLPSRWQEDSSLKTWFPLSAEILERLESENSKLREELRKAREQEPVHWRAVLSDADRLHQPDKSRHVVGFTQQSAAEEWEASEHIFGGWNYSIEPLYASPVPAQKDELLSSTFALWWAMIEAEHELSEEPIKDDQIILNYMGCGASCHVTAGDIRKILSLELKP